MTKTILLITGLLVMFYLAGSIASASFNIKEWSETCRGTVAAFWVLFSFIAILHYNVQQQETQNKAL